MLTSAVREPRGRKTKTTRRRFNVAATMHLPRIHGLSLNVTRHADLEMHLRSQMRTLQAELRSRSDELQQRDLLLKRRDEELAEVNAQLADLQGLFDDVNQQLLTECSRIEHLQESMTVCARQTKDIYFVFLVLLLCLCQDVQHASPATSSIVVFLLACTGLHRIRIVRSAVFAQPLAREQQVTGGFDAFWAQRRNVRRKW